ncbi:hypothetical protein OC846_001284 [Tilletia horrida]|uniref:HMG box domain-containing protein n=1 Tax=Tilletia horrida TaxID=155126 RepID=A0AAN6GTC6_9BASI|nr:hypothetical protein OC846_001284 [Tilletia horrida]
MDHQGDQHSPLDQASSAILPPPPPPPPHPSNRHSSRSAGPISNSGSTNGSHSRSPSSAPAPSPYVLSRNQPSSALRHEPSPTSSPYSYSSYSASLRRDQDLSSTAAAAAAAAEAAAVVASLSSGSPNQAVSAAQQLSNLRQSSYHDILPRSTSGVAPGRSHHPTSTREANLYQSPSPHLAQRGRAFPPPPTSRFPPDRLPPPRQPIASSSRTQLPAHSLPPLGPPPIPSRKHKPARASSSKMPARFTSPSASSLSSNDSDGGDPSYYPPAPLPDQEMNSIHGDELHEEAYERPTSAGTSSKDKSVPHTRKMPEGHIKRPPNAFMLFRSHVQNGNLIPQSEKDQSNASRIAGMMWRSIGEEQRQNWYAVAEAKKAEHARLFPDYKYKPSKRENNAPKRRMKKKSGAEEHCAQVADVILKRNGVDDGVTQAEAALRASHRRAREAGAFSRTSANSTSPAPVTADDAPDPTAARGVRRSRAAADEGNQAGSNKRSKSSAGKKAATTPRRTASTRSKSAQAADYSNGMSVDDVISDNEADPDTTAEADGEDDGEESNRDDDGDDDDDDDDDGGDPSYRPPKRNNKKGKGVKRKGSLGYTIPPARKRTPPKPTGSASGAIAASPTGPTSASGTPRVPAAPASPQVPGTQPATVRSKSAGLTPIQHHDSAPTLIQNNRPFGGSYLGNSSGLGIGFQPVGFMGGKTIPGRLGLQNYTEPISPTTIPPGNYEGMSDLMFLGDHLGGPQYSTVPHRGLSAMASSVMVPSPLGTTSELLPAALGEFGRPEANPAATGPRGAPAFFSEDDIGNFAPELYDEEAEAAIEQARRDQIRRGRREPKDDFAAALVAATSEGDAASGGEGDAAVGGNATAAGTAADPATAATAATDANAPVPSTTNLSSSPTDKARAAFSPPMHTLLAALRPAALRISPDATPRASTFDRALIDRRSTVTEIKELMSRSADNIADQQMRKLNADSALDHGNDGSNLEALEVVDATAIASAEVMGSSRQREAIRANVLRQMYNQFQATIQDQPHQHHGVTVGSMPLVSYGSSGMSASSLFHPAMHDDLLQRTALSRRVSALNLGAGRTVVDMRTVHMTTTTTEAGTTIATTTASSLPLNPFLNYMPGSDAHSFRPTSSAESDTSSRSSQFDSQSTISSSPASLHSVGGGRLYHHHQAPASADGPSPALQYTPPLFPMTVPSLSSMAGSGLPHPHQLGSGGNLGFHYDQHMAMVPAFGTGAGAGMSSAFDYSRMGIHWQNGASAYGSGSGMTTTMMMLSQHDQGGSTGEFDVSHVAEAFQDLLHE